MTFVRNLDVYVECDVAMTRRPTLVKKTVFACLFCCNTANSLYSAIRSWTRPGAAGRSVCLFWTDLITPPQHSSFCQRRYGRPIEMTTWRLSCVIYTGYGCHSKSSLNLQCSSSTICMTWHRRISSMTTPALPTSTLDDTWGRQRPWPSLYIRYAVDHLEAVRFR